MESMRLDVSKALVAEGQEIPFEAEVPLADSSLMGEAVTYPTPARLKGFYASVGDVIHVRGRMAFEARSRCVRCLEDSAQAFETVFDTVFALSPDPDNPDVYVYDGAWIDLTRMAEDAALLALPMQWHCRPDCQGLCPICGVDRNKTRCSCRTEDATIQHPFSALQRLLVTDEMPNKDESEV